MSDFRALLLTETEGKVAAAIETLSEDRLPEGDVLIDVSHSSLNYKDGMIINGLGRLVRKYPHIPGVDFTGTVAKSEHPNFKPGDTVILTGWRVGEIHWGGFAEKARVKGDWLVPLPEGLSPERAMAIGTAGLTAMLAILALEDHGLKPSEAPVLVTGAAGGLGSVAVAVLAKLGYPVAAVTGRPEQEAYLRGLGATEIVSREAMATPSGKPLDPERWAGAVDAVGGAILGNLVCSLRYGASVACCGNAGGIGLNTNVLPLLLRGVNFLGIDSVMCPIARRKQAWERITQDLPMVHLDALTQVVGLGDLPAMANKILKGEVRGRAVIDVRK